MTSTTETNAPAIDLADDDALAARPLPPLSFARDRRKYTRFLDPLHTGPGLQLFESPEHAALGDNLTFVDSSGKQFTQSPPSNNYFKTGGGQLLSFGQIMALAGDFYGVPSQPISDGATPADQVTRFQAAFNTLYNEKPVNNTFQAQNILKLMQQQSDEVSQTVGLLLVLQPNAQDAWSQAYSAANTDHKYDKAYNLATGAMDSTPWYISQGSYMQLAAVNWDHFGANAKACYQAGHTLALQAAAGGSWMLAYMLEAFACHFLTDLFSAGHLRTPRKALHTANPASDLCSLLMHDEDCYNGLVVQNTQNKTWIAYGDKRLNDPPNQTNYSMARGAVVASLNEVIAALQNKNESAPFVALDMIPDLDAVTIATNRANWSPLYVLQNGAPLVRDRLTDLRCHVWTATFLYASTYWRMPTGGVHAITGAPPGQAHSPAHVVAWQNHRIVGSSEDDLAPAAAIVTNLDPALGNNAPVNQFGGPTLPGAANPALQNVLLTVFRKNATDSSNHHLHYIAVPLTDAPAFKVYTPSDIAVGGSSKIVSDGGDPAVVARPGSALMVYPDSSGTLMQATWSWASHSWSSPGTGAQQAALQSADAANYKLLAATADATAPRVALCNLGSAAANIVSSAGLYMAFPTRTTSNGGNIVICSLTGQGRFTTPQSLSYVVNGVTVYPKTSLSVSLVEFNQALLLAFADASSGAIHMLSSSDGKNWTQLTAAVRSANGNPLTTYSALSLVAYGSFVMLVVNGPNGNISTHAYDPATHTWMDYQINGVSNNGSTTLPLQTMYGLSAVAWQGNAYAVFIDKANGAPSIMTTAISPEASS
jgi:hypothetical protein